MVFMNNYCAVACACAENANKVADESSLVGLTKLIHLEPRHASTTTVIDYTLYAEYYMSLVMRKPAFCICENKDADQLPSNCAADQGLCLRYIETKIPLLSKSEISSF